MESNGIKGKIHCSQSSKELLQTAGYSFEDRGDIPVKGKGTMRTFWLTGIPTGSARVVKRAVEAAKQALEELKLDRAGAETSSDDDGAAKARKVPLWDRGRRRSRGMYIDEDDKNRTQVLRQAIETGMKKTASVLDFVSLEQDASGSFTGKSLIDGKRRSPVRQSCFDRASSEEGDASAAVMSVEVCACAPDARLSRLLETFCLEISKNTQQTPTGHQIKVQKPNSTWQRAWQRAGQEASVGKCKTRGARCGWGLVCSIRRRG